MTTMEIEGTGFLAIPEPTAAVQRLYDSDIEQLGFVMNLSAIWAHQPSLHGALFDMIDRAARAAGLTFRQRGILVVASVATLGDSYCSHDTATNDTYALAPHVARPIYSGSDRRILSKQTTLQD